ncbi:hypothetical protein VPH35_056169 [Triticum aestivum]
MARVSGRASPTRLRRPRCRWSTPWEFPIHHGRRHQGLLHRDVEDAMDLQLQGQQGGTLAISTSSDDASATPR